MFISRFKVVTLVALLWATFVFTASAVPNSTVNENSLRTSLVLVENLLTKSSLVKQIKTVNLPQANESLAQALELHEKATKLLQQGDLVAAKDARDEVMRQLMLAGRLANQASGYSAQKPAADYEKKLQSVNALLAAHKRITVESGDSAMEAKLHAAVDALLKDSKRKAVDGNYQDAIATLDKAYIVIAESIKSQRTGKTLVRSLDFATEQEAYDYEVTKYEHYMMLVEMLINERQVIKRDARSKPFFDEASGYIKEATSLASQGQHGKAAILVEKASKTLVNLIREYGVYIPGV